MMKSNYNILYELSPNPGLNMWNEKQSNLKSEL